MFAFKLTTFFCKQTIVLHNKPTKIARSSACGSMSSWHRSNYSMRLLHTELYVLLCKAPATLAHSRTPNQTCFI